MKGVKGEDWRCRKKRDKEGRKKKKRTCRIVLSDRIVKYLSFSLLPNVSLQWSFSFFWSSFVVGFSSRPQKLVLYSVLRVPVCFFSSLSLFSLSIVPFSYSSSSFSSFYISSSFTRHVLLSFLSRSHLSAPHHHLLLFIIILFFYFPYSSTFYHFLLPRTPPYLPSRPLRPPSNFPLLSLLLTNPHHHHHLPTSYSFPI